LIVKVDVGIFWVVTLTLIAGNALIRCTILLKRERERGKRQKESLLILQWVLIWR
jgi:hypothetical protein